MICNVTVSITYRCTTRNDKDANTARRDSHIYSVKNVIFGSAYRGKETVLKTSIDFFHDVIIILAFSTERNIF